MNDVKGGDGEGVSDLALDDLGETDRCFLGTYCLKANLAAPGPSHWRPVLTQLRHSGRVSSHLTRRILHVKQPCRECLDRARVVMISDIGRTKSQRLASDRYQDWMKQENQWLRVMVTPEFERMQHAAEVEDDVLSK
jgi:hypothetical protein